MTDVQQKVLEALRRYIAEHGHSPSITDLMVECDTKSRNQIQQSLNALRDAGMVTWQKGAFRTLRLVEDGDTGTRVRMG